jgi:hypothetical protein
MMKERLVHGLAVLAVVLMMGFGMLMGSGQPTVVHADSATPTPTAEGTNGQPGGDGGGHF